MLLTGRYVEAPEARELGLVNRVVGLDSLAAETEKLAGQIAEASRMVLAIGKQGFYSQVDRSDDAAMTFGKHTMTMNLMAEDAQAGISYTIIKVNPYRPIPCSHPNTI